jgi:hypothetical protein
MILESQLDSHHQSVDTAEAGVKQLDGVEAAMALRAGVSAREKARLKRLAKKRPAEAIGGKGSGKRQQVAQGSTAAPADEV